MLDQVNQDFVNGAVTVIRWGFYLVVAMLSIGALYGAFSWLWKQIQPVSEKDELEKARQRMRELGY